MKGRIMADLNNSEETSGVKPNQVDTPVVLAVKTLVDFAKEMGVKLEFIKFSGPTGYKSIFGVDFRSHIYEDEADLWRHNEVTTAAKNSPDTTTKAEKNANNPS